MRADFSTALGRRSKAPSPLRSAGAVQKLRPLRRAGIRASVLDCGSPLPLLRRAVRGSNPTRGNERAFNTRSPKRQRTDAVQRLRPLRRKSTGTRVWVELAGAVAWRRVLGLIVAERSDLGPFQKRELAPALHTLARVALPCGSYELSSIEPNPSALSVNLGNILGRETVSRNEICSF